MNRKQGSMIPIDAEALKKELEKRGVSNQSASIELGLHKQALTDAMRRGTLYKPTLLALQSVYHINPDDVLVKEQPKETPQEAPALPPLTVGALEEAFFRALVRYGLEEKIYKAFWKAINE